MYCPEQNKAIFDKSLLAHYELAEILEMALLMVAGLKRGQNGSNADRNTFLANSIWNSTVV